LVLDKSHKIEVTINDKEYNDIKVLVKKKKEKKLQETKTKSLILPTDTEIGQYISEDIITKKISKSIISVWDGKRWLALGIFILVIFYLIPQLSIHFNIPILSGLFGKPFSVPLLFTLALISTIFIFLKYDIIKYYYDKWQPEEINSVGLIQLHAAVIIGVFFFLNVALTQQPTGLAITEFYLNDKMVKTWIAGLTASVVIQFSVAAICVAIIGHPTDSNPNVPSGYKLGLLFTFTGFIFLIITMIFLGFAIGSERSYLNKF
jgi:hypothetical protein